MIIFDEDYRTLYRQMRAERERVDYYVKKCQKRALKHLATTPAPCQYTELMTFPDTRNTYLIYYQCNTEKERRAGSCFYGNLLLANDREGRRVAVRLMTFSERSGKLSGKRDSLQVFTGHFLSRYRERFSGFGGLKTEELIAMFAGRNLGYMYQLDYKKMVLPKNQTDNGCVWAMDDGFSFGESSWEDMGVFGKILVVKHKTFLAEEDLKEDQWSETLPVELMRSMLVNHFKV